MISPFPIWGYKYPLAGVFALVCVLINYLFALESISFLFFVSKKPFLGIFALTFLSRLGKHEAVEYRTVWGSKKMRSFALCLWLPLASLTVADSPAWFWSYSSVPTLVLVLGTTVSAQLLGPENSSYALSLLHGKVWLSVLSTLRAVSPFPVWFLRVSIF